jgi:hypothetical protein
MGEGAYSYEAVAEWTSAVDILELDKILIPINVDNTHWIAAMVSMTEKYIQVVVVNIRRLRPRINGNGSLIHRPCQ